MGFWLLRHDETWFRAPMEGEKGTFYALSAAEFENIVENNKTFQKQYDEMKAKADACKDQSSKIKQLEKKIEEYKEKLDKEHRNNENIYRIMRERANADHGITPKKDHNGYVAISQRPYRQRFETEGYRGRTEIVYLNYWQTKIQTPWPPAFSREMVLEEVMKDFDRFLRSELKFSYVESGRELESIPFSDEFWEAEKKKVEDTIRQKQEEDEDYYGYVRCYLPDSEELKEIWDDFNEKKNNQNGVYHIEFEQNFRAGYWEMIMYHVKEFDFPQQYIPGVYKAQYRKKHTDA